MTPAPKWYMPVAVVALLWNVLGCVAYLMDVTLTPEDIAKLSEAQQALYAARPAWSVGATALAVWGGALGSLGLILKKRWATMLLVISLIGVVGQDISLFGMQGAAAQAGPSVVVLQGLVLLVAVGLVMMSRTATQRGWIA
jgi:hypothetical protein